MKNYLLAFLALICIPFFSAAQETTSAIDITPTIDSRINSVMEPVTSAVESVIFFTVRLSQDKEISLSESTAFNGDKVLAKGEKLVYAQGELYQLKKTGEDEDGLPVYDSLSLGTNRAITLSSGEELELIAPVTEVSANDNGLYYIKQGFVIPFVLIWLIAGALIFTFYMKFVNIRGFKHALDVVRGKYDDPNDPGEVSHFQALTAALSGTVGVGNIAGVAIAVSIGGPGATFWMIIAGLLGMSAKFVECSLGVMYRNVHEDGSVSGGPMYYMEKGFKEKGVAMGKLGKVLAVLFAIACIGGSFGGGNMVQINQATSQLIAVTGGEASFLYGQSWIFGAAMAAVVAVIIIGGIKSIAKVTDKVVPFMVGIYVLAALIVLVMNMGQIPYAFSEIFAGAFSKTAMYGGVVGVLIQGFRRAAFSNEAGVGSASIAHSAVKTNEPISEGIVALLEPFIDTVVICTMTALVIVISGYGDIGQVAAYESFTSGSGNDAGIALTSSAFSETISWFPPVLSFAVILFALSTMISWSYYGLKAWTYIFGETKTQEIIYKTVFCIFVVLGSAITARSVFNFGDAMIFAMCFPNILALFVLMPNVKVAYIKYMNKIDSGEIAKVD